jgi:hypothetical protein
VAARHLSTWDNQAEHLVRTKKVTRALAQVIAGLGQRMARTPSRESATGLPTRSTRSLAQTKPMLSLLPRALRAAPSKLAAIAAVSSRWENLMIDNQHDTPGGIQPNGTLTDDQRQSAKDHQKTVSGKKQHGPDDKVGDDAGGNVGSKGQNIDSRRSSGTGKEPGDAGDYRDRSRTRE